MTTDFQATGGVLIIGAGIAGLWTALSMAPRPVTVVTAGRIGDGSSSWAQGGMAAALGPDDSAQLHLEDTIAAGAGLVQREAAAFLCSAGRRAVHELAEIGVPFDRNSSGDFKVGREAAHCKNRIVHIGGDEAGAAIMRTLTAQARQADHIQVIEEAVAEQVLVQHQKVAGALVWDIRAQDMLNIAAHSVIIATGGIGGLFAVTTNPLSSQGHGLALAAEAGATMRDLEFVQFHPTALNVGRDPAPLATEAIRGAGGFLRDAEGVRFMQQLHEDAELAPRDIVARGVATAIRNTGGGFLDVRGSLGESFDHSFPTVAKACREAGLDPAVDQLPIAPAVHYHMGGIKTNLRGETDVSGLYAVGECASTGVHGANRLASNSLLEAIVFGSAVAAAIPSSTEPLELSEPLPSTKLHRPAQSLAPLRARMSKEAGILRSEKDLREAMNATLHQTSNSEGGRLARSAASMILASALERQESRGAHQRVDFPSSHEHPQHTLLKLRQGTFEISTESCTP